MYNLSSDFMQAAEVMERERNIPKEAFIQAICDSILAAYKKKVPVHNTDGVKTVFEEETCEIGIFAPLVVSETVENEFLEISLEEAKEVLEDVQIGEIVEVDVTPEDFSEYGRIAAQSARQMMRQRLGEEEKKLIRQEYETLKHQMVVGQITRLEERYDGSRDIIIDLGRVEAVMPFREQLPNQEYQKGQRLRTYVSGCEERNRRLVIIVSQTHTELLAELFKLEVPEIEEGIVEIIAKARIAGRRAKIAVRSNNRDVDPIGACIGSRGSRIQNVSMELSNEKIDIVPWSEDPIEFISYALTPTQISQIALFDDERALVIVPDDQLSLAIGKGGQNVKLATRLTGWKLDIRSESEAENLKKDKPTLEENQINKEENNLNF